MSKKALLICYGNICRSVMAELILSSKNGSSEWTFSSAGTAAVEGNRSPEEVMKVLAEIGIDASGHRARRLTAEMAEEADLVLTMSTQQMMAVISQTENMPKKTLPLKLAVKAIETVNAKRKDQKPKSAAEKTSVDSLLEAADEMEPMIALIHAASKDDITHALSSVAAASWQQFAYDQKYHIEDPYGEGMGFFREIRDEIEACSSVLSDYLQA